MSRAQDLALLRRFEPILRYAHGEAFYPMDVGTYVRDCSLWSYHPGEGAAQLVPQGALTLEALGEPLEGAAETVLFLRYVQSVDVPRILRGIQAEQKSQKRTFRPELGRLARVGYTSRFVDLLFSVALLARGRVPGAISVVARHEYTALPPEAARHVYYGRVARVQGWTVLQYWLFYAFNNWRTGFYGVNDHEGDWEMVSVYLYPGTDGNLQPEWVALASHDYSGDDLRRRWDDPELERLGEHPVVYAGAGSHAGYFQPGEYLMEVELPFLSPLARAGERLRDSWRRALGGGRQWRPAQRRGFSLLRVPFVDYAHGNGLSIGPGEERAWQEAVLLDPVPGWVSCYRGLWGLYARDPISGENAPGGPMYNRDGSMRRSWYDPLGWAGLDRVAPPNEAVALAAERQALLRARAAELDAQIDALRREVQGLGLEATAIRSEPQGPTLAAHYRAAMAERSAELNGLLREQAATTLAADALARHAERLASGERGPQRAHLRRPLRPSSGQQARTGRIVEGWAAVSVGLLMIGTVALSIFYRQHLVLGLAAMLGAFALVDFSMRGRLMRLIDGVAVGLALACGLVLLYEFFWTVVVLIVVITGAYVIWGNLRELRA